MSLFLKDKHIFHGWALFCHKIPLFSKFMIMSSRSVTSWQELEDPPTCKDNLWIIAWIIRRIIFCGKQKTLLEGNPGVSGNLGVISMKKKTFLGFFWNTYIYRHFISDNLAKGWKICFECQPVVTLREVAEIHILCHHQEARLCMPVCLIIYTKVKMFKSSPGPSGRIHKVVTGSSGYIIDLCCASYLSWQYVKPGKSWPAYWKLDKYQNMWWGQSETFLSTNPTSYSRAGTARPKLQSTFVNIFASHHQFWWVSHNQILVWPCLAGIRSVRQNQTEHS